MILPFICRIYGIVTLVNCGKCYTFKLKITLVSILFYLNWPGFKIIAYAEDKFFNRVRCIFTRKLHVSELKSHSVNNLIQNKHIKLLNYLNQQTPLRELITLFYYMFISTYFSARRRWLSLSFTFLFLLGVYMTTK